MKYCEPTIGPRSGNESLVVLSLPHDMYAKMLNNYKTSRIIPNIAEMLSSTHGLGLKAVQDHLLEVLTLVLILVVSVLVLGRMVVSRPCFCKSKMKPFM